MASNREMQKHIDQFRAKRNQLEQTNVLVKSRLKKTLQALGTDSGIVRWLAWVGRSVAEVLFPNKYGDVITALGRVDPDFEIPRFIKFCEKDVVPNVLEAMVRPDLEVLKDWCTQQEYARLVYLLDERRQKATHGTHCQILDVNNVDVVGGLFTDEGPVLFLSLDTQEMNYSKAADGTVINDSVVMCHHAWALLRDLDEPNPKAAWRLADVAFHTVPMMF
ncbi:mitochondrial import inner membrane translocase subunit TIM44-like [Adelges cooleyi]|uniref:mitochondrial import inner membrane translocase subunit TIM44-like n=1 Tax=Adelges cooleyi TaxID=133065 RepID=UPI002180179D|nr:mitochondrial import inner membrane translocase subunit TIM44-like [Adelges cooleyi]